MTNQEAYDYLVSDIPRWESFNKNMTLHLRGASRQYQLMSREIFRFNPDTSCGQCMADTFKKLHNWRISNKKNYEREI